MTHTKIVALIASALLTLLPLAAFAEGPDAGQRGPGQRGPGQQGPGHRGPGPGGGMIPPADYLDLSEEQAEAAQALREASRAQLDGVREETRALHEQLKATLDSESPDATIVGQLVIDIHALRQRVRAAHEDVESQFADLLDAEQLEKWENFKELRESRRGPGGRGGRDHSRGGFEG